MPILTAVLGDITTQAVDVIVNAANRAMRGGGGVDGAIHRAGGPAILRDCVARFPNGLPTGDAGWTTAGDLPARWVVHTVGPNYQAGQRDRSLLASCYRRSLAVAADLGAHSVAFPLISAGVYGWPRADAIATAVSTIAAADPNVDEVRLVAFDRAAHEEIRAELARLTPMRILQGVQVLHRRGYHDVRALPGMSPSGLHWRVTITTPEGEPAIKYSTGGLTDFAGGEVTVTTTPDTVADLILAALPGTTPAAGDPAYVAWFDDLMRLVERHGKVPIAYADYFDDAAGWEVGWGSGIRHPHPPAPER